MRTKYYKVSKAYRYISNYFIGENLHFFYNELSLYKHNLCKLHYKIYDYRQKKHPERLQTLLNIKKIKLHKINMCLIKICIINEFTRRLQY